MTKPTIQQFDLVPLRNMTQEEFDAASLDFWPRVKPFAEDLQASVDYIEASLNTADGSVQAAQAAQTGAESARDAAQGHAGDALTQANRAEDEADRAEAAVSALPEGTINDAITSPTTAWSSEKIAQEIAGSSNLDIGAVTYSFADLTASGDFVRPGMSYLQSAYPDLFAIIGIGTAAPSNDVTDIDWASPVLSRWLYWSDDGNYLFAGGSPDNYVFVRSDDALSVRQQLTGGTGRVGALSNDGTYLVIGDVSTGALLFYKWDGASYVSIAPPGTLPNSNISDIDFDPSGTYLCVTSTNTSTNRVIVYKRSGDVFTAIDATSWDGIAGNPAKARFGGENGEFLVVGSTGAGAEVSVYQNIGDVFSIYQQGVISGANIKELSVSRDGEYIAAVTDEGVTSGGPYIMRNVGGTYSAIESPVVGGSTNFEHVAVSPLGDFVYAGGEGSADPVFFASISANTVTTQQPPGGLSSRQTFSCAFSDFYLAVGSLDSDLSIYTGNYPFDIETEFYVPDIENLPAIEVSGWFPGVQAKAYVRAQ